MSVTKNFQKAMINKGRKHFIKIAEKMGIPDPANVLIVKDEQGEVKIYISDGHGDTYLTNMQATKTLYQLLETTVREELETEGVQFEKINEISILIALKKDGVVSVEALYNDFNDLKTINVF